MARNKRGCRDRQPRICRPCAGARLWVCWRWRCRRHCWSRWRCRRCCGRGRCCRRRCCCCRRRLLQHKPPGTDHDDGKHDDNNPNISGFSVRHDNMLPCSDFVGDARLRLGRPPHETQAGSHIRALPTISQDCCAVRALIGTARSRRDGGGPDPMRSCAKARPAWASPPRRTNRASAWRRRSSSCRRTDRRAGS